MPLNILDLVLFGQQEKLILCLESKIRLTISIVFYTKDIVFVAVTTLVKQLEILEQDLVNTNSKWKSELPKYLINNTEHEFGWKVLTRAPSNCLKRRTAERYFIK